MSSPIIIRATRGWVHGCSRREWRWRGRFRIWGRLIRRFTQLVSRQQEYRSDELACCIAGPSAMADGLRSVTMIGAVAPLFWTSAIDPMVTAGYLPAVADGFARFYASPAVREGASRALSETVNNPKTSAY